ncbi:fungal-specific transcription factor domain-containing protein [Flagelloscypha sp. PMI_526]|nr:fungal-specific transcription factor domain-containing protein [Flagelloscypha sp. PMI_526]
MATRRKTPSCQECKRMKLRCDRQARNYLLSILLTQPIYHQFPCASCGRLGPSHTLHPVYEPFNRIHSLVRRGCQDICPNGALTPGKGTRYILAGTEKLHSKIHRLRARNIQLEEALASVYSRISNEPHPLLIEGHTQDPDFHDSSVSKAEGGDVQDAIDALGTLAIGDRGQSKYFGPSAGTEAEHSQTSDATELTPSQIGVEPHLLRLSSQFPIDLGLDTENLLLSVVRHFPKRMRAWSLCELYTEQFAWGNSALLREELIDDFLAPIYKTLEKLDEALDMTHTSIRPHRCAVLLLIFALGTWVDLTQDKYWEEADKYYHLARACLSMQSIFEAPEFATVQAIYLLAAYADVRGHLTSMTLHPSWTLLSVASKIAQGLGLHRDVSKWNHLDAKSVNQRRHLFWDLASTETFFSLSMGRPPSIQSSYIDAPFPADSGMVDSEGKLLQGFFDWKHRFTRNLAFSVTETLLAATPPSYEVILKLDRRIREFPIPPHLNTISTGRVNLEESPARLHQTCLPGLFRSVLLLVIHRTHFSRSLQDSSKNPLLSPFAPSFLAAYRSASWITKCQMVLYSKYSSLTHRLWHPWTHVFQVILGCIVIYAPSNPIAENAFQEMNAMCAIYEEAASKTISLRTKNGWKLLQKIQSRAKESYNQFLDGRGSNFPSNISFPSSNFGDDELALFGGQTRILVTKSSPPLTFPPNEQNPQALTQTLEIGENMNIDVHPSLLQFLYTAPVTPLASLNGPNDEFASPQHTAGNPSFGFVPPVDLPEHPAPLPAEFPTIHRDAQFDLPLPDIWQGTEYGAQNGLGGIEDQWQSFLQQLGLDQKSE